MEILLGYTFTCVTPFRNLIPYLSQYAMYNIVSYLNICKILLEGKVLHFCFLIPFSYCNWHGDFPYNWSHTKTEMINMSPKSNILHGIIIIKNVTYITVYTISNLPFNLSSGGMCEYALIFYNSEYSICFSNWFSAWITFISAILTASLPLKAHHLGFFFSECLWAFRLSCLLFCLLSFWCLVVFFSATLADSMPMHGGV